MNLQAQVTRFMTDGDTEHLHEALVMSESLHGLLREAISRSL